jgi:hypothetical protein
MNDSELYLYDAVQDALTPIIDLVESGEPLIAPFETEVAYELTDAYQHALDMAAVTNSSFLTAKAYELVIWLAVEAAFNELGDLNDLWVDPQDTLNMLAEELLDSLRSDLEQNEQQAA